MQNKHNEASVIYGDTLFYLSPKHSKIPRAKGNPAHRMPFCHQSAFVKTALLKQHHFDTSFKICADNAFFMTLYYQGERFCALDMIVSVYDANGISSKPSLTYFKEELRILRTHKPSYIPIFLCKYISMLCKYTIKALLPTSLAHKIQSCYNAK